MQIITQAFIDLLKNDQINESQLTLLGIDITDKSLWKEIAMGKQLSDARAELFILIDGIEDQILQELLINNYKSIQQFRKIHSQNPIENSFEEKTNNQEIEIYCDGGCTPNPGEAGSGIAIYKNKVLSQLYYGLYEEMGTNNTAELNALYQSLLIAEKESKFENTITIKCDSMYAINCIKTWAISWEKKGWTKKGGEIKNLEIIKLSYFLYNKIKTKISLVHIKAHAGFEGNELADRMTMYAIEKKMKKFICYTDHIDIEKLLKMRTG